MSAVRKTVEILAIALGAWTCLADMPAVAHVRAEQRSDGSKKVDIYYSVSDPEGDRLTVGVEASADGAAIPMASLAGDFGQGVAPGTDKHIVWDAGADWNGQYSPAVRFTVTAWDASEGEYLVIDLSGGVGASSYPVSYLTAVPSGGWTDTYKTTRLVLRKIPAGTFTMGSPEGEMGGYSEENQHAVTLTKAFYIGVFEMTQRQWELVMGNRPSLFNNATYYATRPVEQVSYYDIREYPANSDDPAVDWPANSAVTATSFMGKLRAKTGLSTFDLPTESQWECACRAGTATALNSGKNLTASENCPNMSEVGRYYYNGGGGYTQNGDTSVATAKIGSYLPNAWGLYDMHGNVLEWCLDWYGTYPGSAQDPEGAASGSDRMQRGGSWFFIANYCRSAIRWMGNPSVRGSFIGFRVAKTLP